MRPGLATIIHPDALGIGLKEDRAIQDAQIRLGERTLLPTSVTEVVAQLAPDWFVDGRRMDFALEKMQWWNLIQRQRYDDQFSLTCTSAELELRHQAFI
jgi:hypothetical protein